MIILLDDAAHTDEKIIVARWCREFPDLTHECVPAEKGPPCCDAAINPGIAIYLLVECIRQGTRQKRSPIKNDRAFEFTETNTFRIR